MNLEELRTQIDGIDEKMLELFQQRMAVSKQIAAYKQQHQMPILDSARERTKLSEISEKAGAELSTYAYALYSDIMDMSKACQEKMLHPDSPLKVQIQKTIAETPQLFPENAIVACQGVEGAYSQQACDKLFSRSSIMYFNSFEGVFSAVDNGLCRYGVLPLENSTAGSVNKIYDLMMKYNFSIVKSVRLKVDHNLLAKKGTRLEEIREIYSHEQAINQSTEFIKSLGDVKATVCANTAIAAQMTAQSERKDVGALSSRACAELYGLDCIASSVQDKGNNYTRFICISKQPEIYPGADKTSIMMILPHRPGSLYKVLARFYSLNINLIKLESRPLPDRDFEFMFYFDLETSIYSPKFAELMAELDGLCEEFKYLGSYSEVI